MPEQKEMSQIWDQRYQSEEYIYGKAPNAFFASRLENIVPGHLLLPGEGEARNAVYAASRGWIVDAYDQSKMGQQKAMALASEFDVEINYRICQMEDFSYQENWYDVVGLLFFHSDPWKRKFLHRKVFETLKPGGTLILEGFHKEQLQRNSGGPRSIDMLFDEEDLASDFTLFETILLEKKEVVLDEGPFHQGLASVVRFHGIKS